jgi:hypothetical protein
MNELLNDIQEFAGIIKKIDIFCKQHGLSVKFGDVLYYARWGGYPDESGYVYKRNPDLMKRAVYLNEKIGKHSALLCDICNKWEDAIWAIDNGIDDDRIILGLKNIEDITQLAIQRRDEQ